MREYGESGIDAAAGASADVAAVSDLLLSLLFFEDLSFLDFLSAFSAFSCLRFFFDGDDASSLCLFLRLRSFSVSATPAGMGLESISIVSTAIVTAEQAVEEMRGLVRLVVGENREAFFFTTFFYSSAEELFGEGGLQGGQIRTTNERRNNE